MLTGTSKANKKEKADSVIHLNSYVPESGTEVRVDVQGCSFSEDHDRKYSKKLDIRHPAGSYSLDLSDNYDRILADLLLKLRKDHGMQSWSNATISGKKEKNMVQRLP